ncbi:MAG: hypothetical protein JNN09_03115 [Alphaproteobacteria bacterium]|nr:hypothetical protein [Alphaproteobacteria bacterium]
MRLSLNELMDKLGVPYALSAYETYPWSSSDSFKGLTCSAEVRMGPGGDEIAAEIQLIYDTPPAGKPSIQQLMWLRVTPHVQEKWGTSHLRIRNENWENKVYKWEEKCCDLFRACIAEIELGNIPDFDALVDREMRSKERFGDQRGSGAGKAPKIKPAQLLDLKRGGGF